MSAPLPIQPYRPYKSVAAALIFCVFLGPVGLLYASFWGGFIMIMVGIMVISTKLLFCTMVFWVICCILGVSAVEKHNHKVYQELLQKSF